MTRHQYLIWLKIWDTCFWHKGPHIWYDSVHLLHSNYNDKTSVRFALTPHTSLLRASYEVSFVNYTRKKWPCRFASYHNPPKQSCTLIPTLVCWFASCFHPPMQSNSPTPTLLASCSHSPTQSYIATPALVFFRLSFFNTVLHYESDIGLIHDDVIKWKQFLRYWPFVGGIHR